MWSILILSAFVIGFPSSSSYFFFENPLRQFHTWLCILICQRFSFQFYFPQPKHGYCIVLGALPASDRWRFYLPYARESVCVMDGFRGGGGCRDFEPKLNLNWKCYGLVMANKKYVKMSGLKEINEIIVDVYILVEPVFFMPYISWFLMKDKYIKSILFSSRKLCIEVSKLTIHRFRFRLAETSRTCNWAACQYITIMSVACVCYPAGGHFLTIVEYKEGYPVGELGICVRTRTAPKRIKCDAPVNDNSIFFFYVVLSVRGKYLRICRFNLSNCFGPQSNNAHALQFGKLAVRFATKWGISSGHASRE